MWLPDGNVMYFQGKHVRLVLMALLIILIRVPYTLLLFLWQWLVRAPNWKVFKWTRISNLHAFVSAHHIPYNCKYRYIGLACYIACKGCCNTTASVTVFRDPQTSLLVIIFFTWHSLYCEGNHWSEDIQEAISECSGNGLYINLLALSAFSWYHFKTDIEKQTAVAYTSTVITFILLIGVLVYHMYVVLKMDQPKGEDTNAYPLAPDHSQLLKLKCLTVIEIPEPHDQSSPPEASCNTCTTVIGFTDTTN